MPSSLEQLLNPLQQRCEAVLDRLVPLNQDAPYLLQEAIRYSLLNGGKRVRAVLVYLTGSLFSTPLDDLDTPAAALEMIHAYSLIHDDLPAMDDDDLRRGKPTSHKIYGEANAILAGDALQPLAFQLLASDPSITVSPDLRLEMIYELARASGGVGMVGGQWSDMAAEGTQQSLQELQQMHEMKTGALISAAVRLGALASGVTSKDQLSALDQYAAAIGLAFQIRDDILDIEGDTEQLGKQQGADLSADKSTYPALMGLDGAKERLQELHQLAHTSLEPFNDRGRDLKRIADYIVERVS